jgi:uncharacterized protein YerC
MQVSKKKIDQEFKNRVYQLLFQTVADITSAKEAELVLRDLLSKTELSALAKRLGVAYLIKKGKSYQEIKDSLKTSSATISGIVDKLETGEGLQIALKKIKTDEWAEKWSKKIKQALSMK